MLTLITMGQGNPIALKRTLDSFKPHINEVIFGDLLIFEEDRKIIESYRQEYNMRMVKFPFNFIFQEGFAAILNRLASFATNDHVIYMNVSEIMDPEVPMKELVLAPELFNSYFFNHKTEAHNWFRMYNRKEMEWKGLIHEEIHPLPGFTMKKRPLPSFRMADTEKDMENSFKAKVYNDIKELTYFQMYMKLVEEPHLIGVTNLGWVEYAKDAYPSLKERMLKKGNRYEAFKIGSLQMYLDDIYDNQFFDQERQESSTLVNLQGARKDVL